MIKINLLESITERPTGAAMVEARVSSPRVQTLLLAITVFGLLLLGAGYDYVSSNSAQAAAKQKLENEKRIHQQMLAVNKEQTELEKKAKDIQGRIDAIKKLRESQQGPSAVLREVKARFDSVPGLYLKSIEQKDGELTIKGHSPNEMTVTKFGQSLEFSSGLFTNLSIETQREVVVQNQTADKSGAAAAASDAPQAEVVAFTVKCNYGEKPTAKASPNAATSQVAKK
ncbi:MAG TPA: PilN domain-containing protein [Pyrinomonadaceae bacterium]|nr:PilN domain-containing protein [Pyrinomonadaceae bacterium]